MGKPNINVLKDNKKVVHPKSRKAKKLNKQFSRALKMQKRQSESNMKLQVLGDKLLWFKENMDSSLEEYTPKDVLNLIQRYIDRNLEELEQISLKQSIGGRNSNQHASRKDRINITYETETNLFKGAGFETIDLLNPELLKIFKAWNGQLRYLTNFKLRRFKKQSLEDGSAVSENAVFSAVDEMKTTEPMEDSDNKDSDEDVQEED
ncbi:translation machinery-associated protein 16 isoform X1 [Palaemon carinicauda]|uniref:translation machinery-associated protein 16 isoform X1 n=2 Tax=Palaemon carinicauda TaxID=392227 RepID=UPI0035B5A994